MRPIFNAADRRFMKRALALAETALGLASPNPTVGCLIVRNGKIVGRGWHEYDGKDHAEVRALDEAADRSLNATAYVTLEPCCHQGRTPPCTHRLIAAGVRRVVVARIDPDSRVAGKGIESLRSEGVRVDVGLMSEEAGKLIEPYACHRITGMPLVISKVGMSLDGKIGTGLQAGRRITSPESGEFTQDLRRGVDAVLVGVGTVLFDDPDLTYRAQKSKSRPLLRVVLDSKVRTPPGGRLLKSCPESPLLVFCNPKASKSRIARLEREGAEIIPIAGTPDGLDILAVLKELGKRNVLGLLVEGGSRVHWSFLSRDLIDKFYFIVAPLILGGKDSVPSVGGEGYGATADAPKFRIRKSFSVGPDLVLETYPSCSKSIISPWLSQETAASREPDSRLSSKRK
jgi:diaminohydroxyphosphoribosylaminopyrimidine deaminase/5-amino-6-(5-phosphoribosylamino)uracil reductase